MLLLIVCFVGAGSCAADLSLAVADSIIVLQCPLGVGTNLINLVMLCSFTVDRKSCVV